MQNYDTTPNNTNVTTTQTTTTTNINNPVVETNYSPNQNQIITQP